MTPGRTTRMERSALGTGYSSASSEERKKTGETIHSGQFMVSHFETEGPDDEDDDDLGMQVSVEDNKPAIVDTVISNIISKRNSQLMMDSAGLMASTSNAIVPLRGSSSGSADLIRYAQRRQPLQLTSRSTSSQVEIDTDLSTVFNTLNVTYTQKLTSPKWNPFKGIRLRWKEKIRLNNVIWRCWHMQFIMKRKTLVCQFASPLDVDVHNTPQAILLEGKYWKRKCNVIKAEYKKWRRFYANKALGANNFIDTASELDFLEWSPKSSEPLLMITDSMPTDTLLSTLSQYPFPDSREIARGAGRADFIQPSLGPLQPNFEDLMDLDLDFLNFPKLPPVPEEASDELFKVIDYNYGLGSNQLNHNSNIQEISVVSDNNSQQMPSSSNRIGSGSNTVITASATSMNLDQQQTQSSISSIAAPSTIHCTAKIFTHNLNLAETGNSSTSIASLSSGQHQQISALNSYISTHLATPLLQQPLITANVTVSPGTSDQGLPSVSSTSEDLSKDIKPKFHRNLRHVGREPHNYDKCPPTTHQTMAYNLVSQPHINQNILTPSFTTYPMQSGGIIQVSGTLSSQNVLAGYNLQPQTANPSSNPMNLSNNTATANDNSNVLMPGLSSKLITHSQSLPAQNLGNPKSQQRSNSMPTAQNYPQTITLASQTSPSGNIHQQHQQDPFKGSVHPTQTSNYKSYHSHQPQPYKIPSPNLYGSNARSLRHASPPHGHQSQSAAIAQQPTLEQSQQQLQDLQLQQQQQQQQQQLSPQSQSQQHQKRHPPHPTKEMFRSNSLPINATFPMPQKEENFAVPRYQAKLTPKQRTRSNSMIMKQGGNSAIPTVSGTNLLPALHATASEPVLNVTSSALLAQLLTTNSASTLLNAKQHSTSSSAISLSAYQYQQQQHQQQQQQHQQQQQQQQHQQQQHIQHQQSQRQHSHQQSQQQQQQHQAQSLYQQHSLGSPLSPPASQIQSNQRQSPQPQCQSQLSSPANSSGSNSVLAFAASSPSSTLSLSTQALSPDSLQDHDAMMGMTLGEASGSGGAISKHQQNRNENQRRSGHIHAEQKRRYNIKNGFDTLHSLIPQLQQNPNAKLSKAAMLQKGADYIKQLRTERAATNDVMDALRKEIESLNNSLSNLQTALPASGAPVSRQRTGRVKELYQQYVRQRTLDNWKFWIFGLIFEPLMNSYNQTVSVASLDEMCRTSQLWVDQHCSLVELRPAVSNKLRQLSTTTDILSDPPTSLQEEVLKAISSSLPGSSDGSGSNANSPSRSSAGFQ